MELTLEYFDKVNELYFDIEKNKLQGFHQYMKCGNTNILKESVGEYIKGYVGLLGLMDKEADTTSNMTYVNKLFRQRELDIAGIVSIIESISKTVNTHVEDFNYMMKDIFSDDIAVENYIDAKAVYIDQTLNYMCEESLFVLSSLESMHILTEADVNKDDDKPGVKSTGEKNDNDKSNTDSKNGNTKESISSKGKRISKELWEKLKSFFRRIRDMFINKIKSLRKRDEKWLQDNKGKLSKINTDNVIIDVYSDIDKGFTNTSNELISLSNNLSRINTSDNNAYENAKRITDKYRDSNGNLRQGTINYTRSGNAKKEPKLISIKGSQIPTTLSKMYSYCEEYLSKYKTIEKVLIDGEANINKLEQEARRRNLTESFSLIENDLYTNTDLFLCENFNVLLEDTGVRDIIEEKSDTSLSNSIKIIRDEQMIVSAIVTVLESKYFEYIKILRTLLK